MMSQKVFPLRPDSSNEPRQIAYVDIDALVPFDGNPRRIRKDGLQKLRDSIRFYGWTNPVLVQENTNMIVAGHQRVEAARAEGVRTVPVIYLPFSDVEAKAYNLADNRLQDETDWIEEALANILAELDGESFDLGLTGFNEREIEDIRASLEQVTEASEEGDESCEAPAITQAGDLICLGEHRLLCGDCTDLKSLERLFGGGGSKAALVFTDPPYGVSYEAEGFDSIENDDKRGTELTYFLEAAFKNAVRAATDNAAFYIWHAHSTVIEFLTAMKSAGLECRQQIIWVKENHVLGWGDYHWQHEPCLYASKAGEQMQFFGGRKQNTVWRVGPVAINGVAPLSIRESVVLKAPDGHEVLFTSHIPKKVREKIVELKPGLAMALHFSQSPGTVWEAAREKDVVHPTQKPIALAEIALINSSQPGDIVFDPFLGSGCTLLAAEKRKRVCYGIELDPHYCDAIVARWEALSGKTAIRIPASTPSF